MLKMNKNYNPLDLLDYLLPIESFHSKDAVTFKVPILVHVYKLNVETDVFIWNGSYLSGCL